MDDRFRAFPQFDAPALKERARSRQRLGELLAPLFPGTHTADRVARALVEARAVNLKELLESFEFHHRVRRRVRAPVMADLFCGHGLTGLVFAMTERVVERMVLVDERRPEGFDRLLAVICEAAPWVKGKVEYREQRVEDVALEPGTSVLAVHACGGRTDLAIDVADRTGGALALMPCCYSAAPFRGPQALKQALGTHQALDIDRTYRIEQQGLSVDWTAIPAAITPMNRVLIGWRKS